jgi:hypothetical protein
MVFTYSVVSYTVLLIVVVAPLTTKLPPTYKAPLIPAPPATTKAPVEVLELAVPELATRLPECTVTPEITGNVLL